MFDLSGYSKDKVAIPWAVEPPVIDPYYLARYYDKMRLSRPLSPLRAIDLKWYRTFRKSHLTFAICIIKMGAHSWFVDGAPVRADGV